MQQFNPDHEDVNELEVGRGESPPIVEIRDEFARLLVAGEHPRLEACLDQVEPGLRAELLTCLLPLEIAQCQRDGQKYSLAQYLDRFPEYPEIVQGAFRSKSTQVGGETVATTPEPQSEAPAEHLPVRTFTSEDFEERFRDLSPIGKGAQAIVYRALDQRSRTIRALKILLRKSGQTVQDPEIVLQNEAQRLSSLRSRGARVLRFIDIGKMVDGTPYMVLEYHHRGSLRTMLDARDDDSPPPWQKAVEIVIDLAETLAVVHAQTLIHFDVKPDNILIDTDGRPVLFDFAAAATHEDFVSGAPIGITDIYSAPECRPLKQDPTAPRCADGRSDLFSLGVVFYELLTGKQVPMQFTRVDQQLIGHFFGPLINSASQVVSSLIGRNSKLEQPADPPDVSRGGPLQPPNQLVPGLPKAVNEICLEMLEWSIEDRISTATEVAQRLKAALRRDANPPIKQVKTAAMWGGWVATVLVAVGIGKTAEQLVFNWRSGGHFRTLAIGCLNPDSSRLVAMDSGMIQYLSAEVPTLFEWFRVPGPVEGESEITFKVQLPDETRFGLYWGAESIPNDPKRSVIFSGVELTSTRITGRPRQIRRFPGGHPFEVIPGQRVLTVTTSDFSIRHTLDQNNNPVDIPQLHAALVANLATPNRAINPLSFPLPYSEAGEIREIEVSLHFNHGVLTTITINNEQRNVIDQPNGRLSGSVGFFLESYQVFLSPPKFSRK